MRATLQTLDAVLVRLDAAERRLAQYEADRARLVHEARRSARQVRLVLAVVLACLVALVPYSLFSASFVDLNPGSPHNGNINAIADAGISKGCIDLEHYCPNELVTREQMASFLARTAGLGGNPPVANANQLAGQPASAYLLKSGDLVFEFSPLEMVSGDPAVSLAPDGGNVALVVSATSTGGHGVALPLPVPSQLFGVPLKVKSVRVCYLVTNSNTKILATTLKILRDSFTNTVINDATERTSVAFACYEVTPTVPVTLEGAPLLTFQLNFNSTGHTVRFLRVQLTLMP